MVRKIELEETYEKDIEVISSKIAAQGNKYILGKNYMEQLKHINFMVRLT